MKVIDPSLAPTKSTSLPFMDRLLKKLQSVFGPDIEQIAQEALVQHLSKLLDNKYTLLRNVTLPGLDVKIPLVLVGTTGIRVIYASAIKGIYRAKNETWAVMGGMSQHFQTAKPNLVQRVLLMTATIKTYLNSEGIKVDIEAVLFLSDPGIHVDTIHPAARIVLTDAVDRFTAGIMAEHPLINSLEVERITNILARSVKEESIPTPTEEIEDEVEPSEPVRLPFTRKQWLLLGSILLLEVVILIAFAFLVFSPR